jgi:1,2-dihydroxy-3-keto-5-methylthiopentene dioxygenase
MNILFEQLPSSATNEDFQAKIEDLKISSGYVEQDEVYMYPEIVSEQLLEKFAKEHKHSEDEIRLIVEGEGIFHIRDENDEWKAFDVYRGSLIGIPAGCWHTFQLTEKKTIRAVRLFKNKEGWIPDYRND